MRWRATAAGAVCGLLLVALAYGFPSQPRPSASPAEHKTAQMPAVIFTAAPVYQSLAALYGRERFPRGAQLVILRSGQMLPLVPDFAATADANVSFDGKAVLFAGKKTAQDPWQIWQIPVEGGTPQPVISAKTDLIRPLWMPDHRIVYARREAQGFALETAGLDGSHTLRLSYLPGSFIPDDVLRDGRVLFEAQFPLGADATLQPVARSERSQAEMFLVYADGSGVESVRCDHPDGLDHAGRDHGHQIGVGSSVADAGDIVFIQAGRLARFTSALADAAPVAAPSQDYAGEIAELPDGRWILSARRPGERHFAMSVWKPGAPALTRIAQDAERNLVEPVVVAPRAVPNRHPSALHEWAYGNLLALDARQSRGGDLTTSPAMVRAETLDEDGRPVSLGTAPVENDGSFFVQAAGDRPLRFILLDAAGHPLREEHGWYWVRRGEQRVCVGCH
ncbi:MAG TPA: hypothetical protein VHE33_02965, partial [Acidobacteriaceae bacterium]|nr:hypothetical protein [Acidobacteriaceae bacterium]